MENFCNLHGDVVIDILLLLPVESLMRFKCVCKSWYALISSPQFIAMHLNHNKNNKNACILLKHCFPEKKQNILSLISDVDNDEVSSIVNVNLDIPFDYKEDLNIQLVGHCNGIICLSDCWDDIFLCNPAMREFRVLPKSKPSNPNMLCYAQFMGFGYDSQTNDYKVVRIMKYWSCPLSTSVQVYTLSTDSWREIKDVQLGANIIHSLNFQMHFNGVYYWRTEDVILSFDIVNEVFRKIPLPKFCSIYGWGHHIGLMVFNESITVVLYPVKADQKSFDFWVMDDFGVKGSWTKLFSVGPLSGVEMPLVFSKNSVLLIECNDGQIVSYNLKTQKIKKLPIYGIPNKSEAMIYLNSLVSIKTSQLK